VPSTDDANNLDDPRVKVIGGEFNGPQLFGASTAMGDVNGDGFADLIVGAPASINGAGHLYVFYAIEVAPGSALVVQGNATGTSTQLSGDTRRRLGLGASVAAGDVNGDGITDVVIGAPGTASRARPNRAASTCSLRTTMMIGTGAPSSAQTTPSSRRPFVSAFRKIGDGMATAPDVIAGATPRPAPGQVYVFHAAADTGIPATFDTAAAYARRRLVMPIHIVGEETRQLETRWRWPI
jgi:hypothetical protein